MRLNDLREGETYSWAEVRNALGDGSPQFYLPFRGDQVFGALLKPDMNPDAPRVVLVGSAPRVAAGGERFLRQRNPVPTFIKRAKNQWEYQGMYRVAEDIRGEQATALAASAGRHDVAFALRLERIERAQF